MRKTYDVAAMVKTANAYLANSDDKATEFRMGVATMLESVLMATGNYSGLTVHVWLYPDPTVSVDWFARADGGPLRKAATPEAAAAAAVRARIDS